MSKDATIQKIIDIQPIEGADRIEVATVLGWKVVVKKGEFKIGDLVIYICIDSVLPKLPQYEFIKNIKKTEDGKEWYYVKTVKLRKQISQGLILPVTVLNCKRIKETNDIIEYNVQNNALYTLGSGSYASLHVMNLEDGLDVSEILGVEHYEKQIHGSLAGIAKGNFPSFISKTDEERIQNIPKILEELKGKPYYITTKCDGTSFTAYYREGQLGICSRKLELIENPDNAYWKIAQKYDLLNVLGNYEDGYLAIQGELCGPSIQKNPMGLTEVDLFVFNVYDITKGRYFTFPELNEFCLYNKLKMVPVIEVDQSFNYTLDQLLEKAKGKYKGTENNIEGIVIRSFDKEISFKVLNNDYLLKEE